MTRRCYAVLAQVSLGYPPLEGRLVTCYSPVRHFTQGLLPFLVRLACVRHAASVDSEPGSNSRLILVCSRIRQDGGPRSRALHTLERHEGKTCENWLNQKGFAPHDWHVQPCCQRSSSDQACAVCFGSRKERSSYPRTFIREQMKLVPDSLVVSETWAQRQVNELQIIQTIRRP